MASPSYTEDLIDIDLAESAGAWAESSDGAWDDGGGPVADVDYPFIQGSYSISQQMTKASICSLLVDAGTGLTLPTDGAYFVWQTYTAPGGLDTYANGGMRLMVGSGLGDFYSWDVGGSDFGRNPYGGWMNEVVNPVIASPDDTVGSPTTTEQFIGAACKTIVGIGKGNPHAVDAVRYGRGSSIFELGESGDPATFAGYAAVNDAIATMWGLLQAIAGGYLYKGKMTLGTVTNAVYFSDANIAILIDNTPKVTANFNTIEINNASSTVIWTNVRIASLGIVSPGRLLINANATVTWNLCQFDDMGAFTFGGTNSVCTNAAWRNCGIISAKGADLSGSSISGYEGTADTSVLLWDTSGDPDGELDNMSFTKGTASTHAIEFDATNTPTTITLRGIDFSGYNAANGNTDSALYFPSTTKTYTVNLVGCTGDISYKVGSGGTVNLVINPVTLSITAKDKAGVVMENVRIMALVASSANSMPYNTSVSISRSTTTATVTHTAHGLSTGDYVRIANCTTVPHLNGVREITVTTADAYTYTCEDAGGASDTGGDATLAIAYGLSTALGIVTGLRSYATADQPISGWGRKSTSAPFYSEGRIGGTIDKENGLSIEMIMGSD